MAGKKIYCTAPWNGLTIREDGQVKTCCVGQRGLGNLNSVSIQEIEKSPALKQIQQGMIDGEPDYKNCKVCIDSEKTSGNTTLRHHYNRWYPGTNNNQLHLKFIDVRWNNVCNLSCMYCTPMFSSTWADKLAVEIKNQPIKQYQDDLLDWILERADHVNEIMLVGGEPMLMKQNYELLKKLPKNCQISIITNLSYDLENNPALPLLMGRPSEKINWNVSLENTDKQFEYVRSGAAWSQTKKNLELLVKHWPNTVSLNMVYSLFSAFDILDTVKKFHGLGIKKFNLFNINDNDCMNVLNMPDSVKQQALDQLQKAHSWHNESLHPDDKNLYPWQGIESLISALNESGETNVSLSQFQEKIAWYDQWNQNKFADLWPEVTDLIHLSLQ